jgi:hypothetical protein
VRVSKHPKDHEQLQRDDLLRAFYPRVLLGVAALLAWSFFFSFGIMLGGPKLSAQFYEIAAQVLPTFAVALALERVTSGTRLMPLVDGVFFGFGILLIAAEYLAFYHISSGWHSFLTDRIIVASLLATGSTLALGIGARFAPSNDALAEYRHGKDLGPR